MLARIYKVTNILNSKVYIGFTTKTVEQRLKIHFYKASLSSEDYVSLLHRAIKKHGKANFKIEELYTSKDIFYTLNVMEAYFIKEFDSIKIGYNLTLGGQSKSGAILSTKTKDSISKGNSRNWKLISVSGKEYIVTNLLQWGIKQGIESANLSSRKKLLKYGIARVEKVA